MDLVHDFNKEKANLKGERSKATSAVESALVRAGHLLPLLPQWEGVQKRRSNSCLAGGKEGEGLSRKLPGDGVAWQGGRKE